MSKNRKQHIVSAVQKLLTVMGVIVCMVGCVGPVVNDMTTDFPATVLYAVGTPPVTDDRIRFREIFCQLLAETYEKQRAVDECEQFLLRLNDEPVPSIATKPLSSRKIRFRVMIVPGFLNECFSDIALPFADAIKSINDSRYQFVELVVSGRSSSDFNAVVIAQAIENLKLDRDEKLVLVGHSKGAVDILHFLVNYPEMAGQVSAVVSVAGSINGSRLAERGEAFFNPQIRDLLSGQCEPGDDLALFGLRPSVSMSWLATHPLPNSVRYFSIVAFTERKNINTILKFSYDLLSVFDSRNDGLLLISDQLIPGGTLLGYANADHLSVVLPLEDGHFVISGTVQATQNFPRNMLLQAVLLYLAEALENHREIVQLGN